MTLGALLAGGGIGAYVRAKSVPSLVAGVTSGGLMIGSAQMIKGGDNFKGHALGAATSAAIAFPMGMRAVKSGKLFPAGAVALLGLIGLGYNGKQAVDWYDSE